LNFLKTDRPIVSQSRGSILLEWWRVSLDEVQAFLTTQSFSLVKVLEENDQMGTAYFRLESRR
jgi:hypothetical protein